ncbi:hypothetical protein EON81_15015 [bacterium]|nr:MAG: hypothetical protein EON81_15015 [bacterium]
MAVIRCHHLNRTLPLALLGLSAFGCVPKIVPAAGVVDIKLEVVLENLRAGKTELVLDSALRKAVSGNVTI